MVISNKSGCVRLYSQQQSVQVLFKQTLSKKHMKKKKKKQL